MILSDWACDEINLYSLICRRSALLCGKSLFIKWDELLLTWFPSFFKDTEMLICGNTNEQSNIDMRDMQ